MTTNQTKTIPLGLDDYEPLDMQEKYWTGTDGHGYLLLESGSEWRIASLNPNDLLPRMVECVDAERLVQVSLSNLMFTPPSTQVGLPLKGVAILDGYPNVARYITVRPGERP